MRATPKIVSPFAAPTPPTPPPSHPPDCLCLFPRRRIITFALHGETPAIHHPNEVQPGPRSITRCLVSQPR